MLMKSLTNKTMAIVNFSVPDDVRKAFNNTFKNQNKSAVIAELMREAVERVQRRQRSHEAIDRILARYARAPVRTDSQIRTAREKGRP
jgi:Zn-finger domain-containing protein